MSAETPSSTPGSPEPPPQAQQGVRSHSPELPSPPRDPSPQRKPPRKPTESDPLRREVLHRLSGRIFEVSVDILIQDRVTAQAKGLAKSTERHDMKDEDFFLDGPISRSVAVLDFDPADDSLLDPVRLVPPKSANLRGRYDVPLGADGEPDTESREFIATSVFGTVHRTMALFSNKEVLGRPLTWAFGSAQLLVVPRAGEMPNAFYERESKSLQLFFFTDKRGRRIHTALSRDIVAHETGHAILDGIAPDLYDSCTPQSLALHESIADMTALFMAFNSSSLSRAVLDQTRGSIADPTAFSNIAEEFGQARDENERAQSLRQLRNDRTFRKDDLSKAPDGTPNSVSSHLPHALSEVLSGALYSVMLRLHAAWRTRCADDELARQGIAAPQAAEDRAKLEFSVSGRALGIASKMFRRFVFRGLDYLPPGEVSFADFGRAILAADRAAHPETPEVRDWLVDAMVERGIVANRSDLDVRGDGEDPAVAAADLEGLAESDYAAYAFANANRELLNIPPNMPFEVRPRLDVTKETGLEDGAPVRELIFKVAWQVVEDNDIDPRYPARRRITCGTTLVVDLATKRVRAVVTSDHARGMTSERTAFLKSLASIGELRLDDEARGPDRRRMRGVHARSSNGVMRVRSVARMVHLSEESP